MGSTIPLFTLSLGTSATWNLDCFRHVGPLVALATRELSLPKLDFDYVGPGRLSYLGPCLLPLRPLRPSFPNKSSLRARTCITSEQV